MCGLALSEVSLRWLIRLPWLACFTCLVAVGVLLMKAVSYWLMWIDVFKLTFEFCESGVVLIVDFVVDSCSGVDDGLHDAFFLVWPCLLVHVADGGQHFGFLV